MRPSIARSLAAPLAALALSACVAGGHDETPGRIAAVVKPISAYQVTRVTVALDGGPATDLAYRSSDGSFTGTVLADVGPRQITATAYAIDAASTETAVGTGTATVTVEANKIASVFIKILDQSGPPAPPDHGPIVTSMSVSNLNPLVGDIVDVSAEVVDPDGDVAVLTWSARCASGDNGWFPFPSVGLTTWTPNAPGPCTLTITAESKNLSTSQSIDVVVFQLTGGGGGTP